jgi:hypothetical protein
MRIIACSVLLLATQPLWAEPIDDPWALVPELPNSCYSERDDFQERAYAAMNVLSAERSRQSEINMAISQQSADVDPMELQQRMMEFLMEHPEEAQAYMEGLMQTGQEFNEETPERNAQRQQLEDELNAITSRYDTTYQDALGPLDARYGRWVGEGSVDEAAEDDGIRIVREMNANYETLCETWWKNGPFHDWLARDRQFLIEDAAEQEKLSATTIRNYELTGVPTADYRSTVSLEAAHAYLQKATQIFNKRLLSRRRYE